MGKPIEITDANFDTTINEGVTLVDFWAPWCGPCRMVGPVMEQLADTYEGKIKVVKLNVDDNQVTAAKFKVMSIPTVMVFKNGQLVESMVGADPSGRRYVAMIEKHASVAAN